MNRDKRKDLIKKLLKEAYKLGFEVGYHGHSEVAGKIGRKRFEIFKMAKKFGIQKECQAYYEKGKEEGKQRRAKDMWKGKAGDIGEKKESHAPRDFVTILDGEYEGVTKEPEFTQEPTMTQMIKALDIPGFLQGFRAGLKKPRE